MKKILLCLSVVLAFAFTKPPTFAEEFQNFEQSLYEYALAKENGGDTVSTKSAMISARQQLHKYNVQQELSKMGPVGQLCRWACAGQYFQCDPLDLGGGPCWGNYIDCLRGCGLL